MLRSKTDQFHLDLAIGNARIVVTMSGGFFDLGGETASSSHVHSHNNYEFHLVIEGGGRIETESGNYELSSAEAVLIPPGVVHKGIIICEKRSIKTNFSFSLERVGGKGREDIYSYLNSAFGGLTSAVVLPSAGKYSDYLERIFIDLYSASPYAEHRLRSLFYLFITDLAEDIHPETLPHRLEEGSSNYLGRDSYTLIKAIMEEYVTRNFQKQITLADLAAVIHLSEKQTARVFVKNFGITFKQYIKQMRLNSAKYLLAETDIPLDRIASEAGYLSYNGFYKLFRGETNMSPAEYREIKKRKVKDNNEKR